MRFEICNFLFEYYFGRVFSEEAEGFPFNEAFFNSLRVTGSKMCILKCLSGFQRSTHSKDCVSFESFPFVDVGVQECCFLIGNFSRKFDRRVNISNISYALGSRVGLSTPFYTARLFILYVYFVLFYFYFFIFLLLSAVRRPPSASAVRIRRPDPHFTESPKLTRQAQIKCVDLVKHMWLSH